MSGRPREFMLNYGHHLAQGLVFAGLGRHANSTHYRDSSLYGNHGTLTNMAVPATATSGWAWDNYLRRWVIRFDGSDDQISIANFPYLTSGFTVIGWFKPGNQAAIQSAIGGGSPSSWALRPSQYLNLGKLGYTKEGVNDPASSYVVDTNWHSLGIIVNGNSSYYIFDGTTAAATFTNPSSTTIGLVLGKVCNDKYTGSVSDPMIYSRILSFPEIAALADPSNVMLSGLILPPRRRVWAAAAATGNRRRRLLITGAYR